MKLDVSNTDVDGTSLTNVSAQGLELDNVDLTDGKANDVNLTRFAITNSNITGMTVDGDSVEEALAMLRAAKSGTPATAEPAASDYDDRIQ